MADTGRTPVTCENCNLDKLCIPKGMSRAEIGALKLLVNRDHIRHKGDALYHAGSPFRGILALRSGSAKLVSLDRDGNSLVVDFVLPGELLGFDGLATQTQQCSALALETVNFCHLPSQRIDGTPGLHQALLHHSCAHLDAHIAKLQLGRKPAEARVASFIVQVSERLQQRGYSGVEFRLSMSREDIGSHLGIAHETVSRVFNHFQSFGIIDIKAKRLVIKDKKKLQGFCRS